jgi:hypothetical protein
MYYWVCNGKHCVNYRNNRILKTKWMVSKLLVLTLVSVCILHWSELDWVREFVVGHVNKRTLTISRCTVCMWKLLLPILVYLILRTKIKIIRKCFKKNQLGAQFFLICLLLFFTCFGQLCAHHQEKIPYLWDTWYLSLYMDDCLVWRTLHIRQSSIYDILRSCDPAS